MRVLPPVVESEDEEDEEEGEVLSLLFFLEPLLPPFLAEGGTGRM